jgi:hypothetical protein
MKVVLLLAALCLLVTPATAQKILKGDPAIGAVKEGARVLIDDGTCPQGQIKEIVGGNIQKHIARQSRCIPRRK